VRVDVVDFLAEVRLFLFVVEEFLEELLLFGITGIFIV
jgi:hypothetical protein